MSGGPYEQDLADMDAKLTAQRIRANKDVLVGVKVAHYQGAEWEPVTRAVEAGPAGRRAGDDRLRRATNRRSRSTTLLNTHLRPGDIFTHMYAHVRGRTPIVNAQGQVEPFVLAARKRGVIFDVGHGGGSFLFRQAVPATKQGFYPDVISTDLHTGSMNAGMKDLLNVMSKMLNLGMPLKDTIRASTTKPAEIVKRPELGHLGVGAEADVAVLGLRKGDFAFVDSGGLADAGHAEARVRDDGEGRTGRVGPERALARPVERAVGAPRRGVGFQRSRGAARTHPTRRRHSPATRRRLKATADNATVATLRPALS